MEGLLSSLLKKEIENLVKGNTDTVVDVVTERTPLVSSSSTITEVVPKKVCFAEDVVVHGTRDERVAAHRADVLAKQVATGIAVDLEAAVEDEEDERSFVDLVPDVLVLEVVLLLLVPLIAGVLDLSKLLNFKQAALILLLALQVLPLGGLGIMIFVTLIGRLSRRL
jgi:hypothetical protein